MHEKLEQWCFEELKKLLGSPSEEIVKYILEIKNHEELEDFLVDLFGHLDSAVREKFVNDLELLRNKFEKESHLQEAVASIRQETQPEFYRKPPEEDLVPSNQNTSTGKNKHKGKRNRSQGENTNDKSHIVLDPLLAGETKSPEQRPKPTRRSGNFVPLYDSAQVVQLPGRHPCLCQASQHSLINNCIKCGRIVCAQEGSGPCFTCGALVCTPQEQIVLNRGSKKSEQLYKELTPNPDVELLRRANEHKNKLLEYNITAAQRTKVIDDECDYFSLASDKWISQAERDKLMKKAKEQHDKKHGSRFGKAYSLNLDFAGRRISMDNDVRLQDSTTDDIQDGVSRMQLSTVNSSTALDSHASAACVNDEQDVHPMIPVTPPLYVSDDRVRDPVKSSQHNVVFDRPGQRLQDRELQELCDQGFCLSMHQPWASLLIRGIKIHEGRTWYTAYRGTLWIHSAGKVPLPEDISKTENMYKMIYQTRSIDFPKQYPPSCLLGTVNLVDCLPQEEYRKVYPDGESESPYVFICENPQELLVKIPMAGRHKIFRMDSNIHKTVKKSLRKLNDKNEN